ncbi:Methyltransferase-like protein 13 [Hondaea fermentalgiana]|uniref:Methyltransferase-like protein 13 n=1 Tax=Hondaea fermentalgiana TaxID=2315210 RepID=A0A2R5GRV1_9STRA|nr:Methyltransferase-like protein 13 [Hondaea fermentalgiana]|eukprot:GBG33616.1 Methyltransferase-like protein 13 [Hondaea fermentalgiana]
MATSTTGASNTKTITTTTSNTSMTVTIKATMASRKGRGSGDHEHHGHSHGDHHHHDSSAMEVQIRPGVTKHVMCVRHDLGDDCTCPSCTHTETDNKKFWDKLYSLNAEQDTDSEYLLAYESLASALAKQMIVETGRGTPSEARVLLPGCGDSRFSVSMYQASVFKHITNTDISEVAIKMQDKYFDHLKAATVTNLVDDAAKTRLPPQSFDLVIDKSLLDCLSYCSDDETTVESRISRLMAGFYEVLAPGGRCILVVSEQNEPANVLPYVSEAWAPVNAMLMDAICCGSALAPKPWEVMAVVSLDYAQDGHGISRDYHAISGALLEWSAQVLPTLTTIETSCQQWVTELRIFRQNPYRIRQAEQLKAELRHTDNVDPDATSSIGHLAASQAQTFKIKLSSVQVRYVSARRHVETILRTQASALETRWVSQKLMHVKLALDRADVALNEVTKLLPSASFGGWVG